MYTFILLLALCGVTDSCIEIAQVCYKCRGVTSVCSDGPHFQSTPDECVSHVMTSLTSAAAHFSPALMGCYIYTCTNNLYFTDTSRFAVRQTCNADCSNFTLIEHVDSSVTADPLSSATESIGQCFADCFETVGCYMFSYDGSICNIYTYCGTSCTVTSLPGSTVYTRTCHGGIQVANCVTLKGPLNGVVNLSSGTTYNNQATYTCFSGYKLDGSSKRICQIDGHWSGFEPDCIPVDCGTLTSPPYGGVDTSSGTTYLNQAVYTCSTGHMIIGNISRICQSDGKWSGSEPSCWIVDCGSLSAPENGNVQNPVNTTYLKQAIFSCSLGYIIAGSNQRICQSNGLWNGSSPICNPVDCGIPTPLNDGVMVAANGTTYGQNATFSCNAGFTLDGFDTTECNASGLWDYSPSCNEIDCGFLTTPANGVIEYPAGTTFGETAMFWCNTGYYLSHKTNQTCQSNGLWSMTSPLCIRNGIPEPVQIYLAPCICYSNKTFTGLTHLEIIDYLVKETKIEKNSTALARRKLESAKDRRVSSQIVGYTGVFVIAGALGIIFLSDILTICQWWNRRNGS